MDHQQARREESGCHIHLAQLGREDDQLQLSWTRRPDFVTWGTLNNTPPKTTNSNWSLINLIQLLPSTYLSSPLHVAQFGLLNSGPFF
jgi:hypothetical protein